MDRVFSTRMDEATIDVLERATRQLRISKKRFIEEAIRLRAQAASAAAEKDVWAETAGTWKRAETPASTVEKARTEFRTALQRHHRGKYARLHR